MPVAAVIFGGRPRVISGSSTAYFGTSVRSMTAYLWWVSSSVMTAAIVVSEPVPAVVGTAMKGGSFFSTRSRPAILPTGLFGRTTRAAAALAESIGEPPPMAMKPSQPFSTYMARTFSTVLTRGLASTSANMTHGMPALSRAAVTIGASFLPTLGPVTMMGLVTFSFFRISGIFSALPMPETWIGLRQCRKCPPMLKKNWYTR